MEYGRAATELAEISKNILQEQNGRTRGLNHLCHVILQDRGLHEDTKAAVGCENLSNVCEHVYIMQTCSQR